MKREITRNDRERTYILFHFFTISVQRGSDSGLGQFAVIVVVAVVVASRMCEYDGIKHTT